MTDYLERILDEASQAVERRIHVNRTACEGLGLTIDAGDKKAFNDALRAYERQLRTLRRAVLAKGKQQVDEALERIFDSFAPKLIATVRLRGNDKKLVPFGELEACANDLSLHKAYHESVAIKLLPGNPPGAWRPISLSGTRRKAQQLIIRDVLLITNGDSQCDSTVKGAGGEVQLFED